MIKVAAQWWYIGQMSSLLKISYLTTGLNQLLAQEERCDDGWMFIAQFFHLFLPHKRVDRGVLRHPGRDWKGGIIVEKKCCVEGFPNISIVTNKSCQTCLLDYDDIFIIFIMILFSYNDGDQQELGGRCLSPKHVYLLDIQQWHSRGQSDPHLLLHARWWV